VLSWQSYILSRQWPRPRPIRLWHRGNVPWYPPFSPIVLSFSQHDKFCIQDKRLPTGGGVFVVA
jgi:hypothetical protein